MAGYIKLYREIEHTSWYSNSDAVRVFIHLLLRANHADDIEIDGRKISAGQLVSSYARLCKEIYFDLRRLKKAIEILVNANSLTIEDFGKNKIFKITNWEMYQCKIVYDTHTKLQGSDSFNNLQESRKKEKERYIIYNNISKEKESFTPPTMEEVAQFIFSINSDANTCEDIASRFVNYYSSLNWHIGNTPITNWEGLCRNWLMNEGKNRR